MSASEILKLIETVSPDDLAKLDEIDARVYTYLHDFRLTYRNHERVGSYVKVYSDAIDNQGRYTEHLYSLYTRSRDALKAIRPKGWKFDIVWNREKPKNDRIIPFVRGYIYEKEHHSFGEFQVTAFFNTTEELAELHAILQAIEYERGNK